MSMGSVRVGSGFGALVAVVVMGLALAACKDECEQSLHCEPGEVCSDGACVPRTCGASADCPLETFCDDEQGICQGGCQSDRDCYPYHRCDEDNQCISHGCRSTVLDCSMGEYCDPVTGECFMATGSYCKECEREEDCGTGNMCLRIGDPSGQTYCGVDCSTGQECPRGYSCGRVVDPAGNTVGYQCVSACWLLEE